MGKRQPECEDKQTGAGRLLYTLAGALLFYFLLYRQPTCRTDLLSLNRTSLGHLSLMMEEAVEADLEDRTVSKIDMEGGGVEGVVVRMIGQR